MLVIFQHVEIRVMGVPAMDDRMYRRMGMCPEAIKDLADAGGCVVAQIVAAVKISKKREVGKSSGGRSTL